MKLVTNAIFFIMKLFDLPTLLKTSLLVIIIWCIQHYFKKRRVLALAAQYDGPRALPFIGNIFTTLVPLTDMFQNLLAGCLYYKSPIRLWFGPYLSVQIWDPENAKIVLNSPHALEKEPYLYSLFEYVTGHGLLTSRVYEWKSHRKLIAPLFNQKYFKHFSDTFSKHSKLLVLNLQSKMDKGIFCAHEYLIKYSMDSAMEAILDLTPESVNLVETNFIRDWAISIWIGITTRMTNIWYFSDFICSRTAIGKELAQARAHLGELMISLIKKWEENSIKKYAQTDGSYINTELLKPMNLVQHAVSISNGSGKFTTQELHGELLNILTAAMETTSSTLGYLLILLGMHPEVQETAYQEITNVIGTKPQLEYNDLSNLQYLERVIKESLRLFPGIVAIARCNDQEIQLTNHIIPANTSIIILLSVLHRDPNIWPDPTKFDPDRFLPEEEAKRHPYSWIPFLAGPRNCIALKYANVSLKIALATILLNYKVTTNYKSVDDVHITAMTVLKPTNGYNISITAR